MTLDITKLQGIKTVVTHADCSDGLASAMIIRSVLPEVDLVFLQYKTDGQENLKVTDGMLFVDFSPSKTRVKDFVDGGALVLDHHKYQKDIVKAFGANGVFADEVENPGIAGAMLAYTEVWLPLVKANPFKYLNGASRALYEEALLKLGAVRTAAEKATGGKVADLKTLNEVPEVKAVLETLDQLIETCPLSLRIKEFATSVSVRDTWQKTNPKWYEGRTLNEALRFFSNEVWLSDLFPAVGQDSAWNLRCDLGHNLVEKQDRKIAKILASAYRTEVKGKKVQIHQGVSHTSDLAEASAAGTDYIIGFSYLSEEGLDTSAWPELVGSVGPKIVLSCRSRNGVDVGAFAVANGGGGHSAAAGFSYSVKEEDPNPYVYILSLIRAYLTA